jgi:hypothetical protein
MSDTGDAAAWNPQSVEAAVASRARDRDRLKRLSDFPLFQISNINELTNHRLRLEKSSF